MVIDMTMDQIIAVGTPTDSWVGLEQFCNLVSLQDDNCIFVDDADIQFYFESSSGLMFIRYLYRPYPTKDTSEKEGTVILHHNGNTYRAEIHPNGANDKTIGRYHDVICVSDIAAFLKHKN